jgi:aminoglycoside/choline kinase family phosphotransferase
MDQRQQQLQRWLQDSCQLPAVTLTPMRSDASFRRYFRVQQEALSFVAMDAPPERETNTKAFVTLARALYAQGVKVPEVIVEDVPQGFVLLSDFGDHLYLNVLANDNVDDLYTRALSALTSLQACDTTSLAAFSPEFMYQELQTAKEWFLQKHLNLDFSATSEKMLADFFHFVAEGSASQPQVFMHRDYQSGNLLVLPGSEVGILDFQDAFVGPVTYDLVSLLRDCYIAWPTAWVQRWALQFKNSVPALFQVKDEEFLRWFDVMGMQRHVKALLTFSRKFHRDGNANYLQHIPRTLNYIVAAAQRYPQSAQFHDFLTTTIIPQLARVATICEQ